MNFKSEISVPFYIRHVPKIKLSKRNKLKDQES